MLSLSHTVANLAGVSGGTLAHAIAHAGAPPSSASAAGRAASAVYQSVPAPDALGLSSTTWTAIAAGAQACAAFGALALLTVTWLAHRNSKQALEASMNLALHTEALVRATRDAQALAVRPVIDVHTSFGNGARLLVENTGNGPLINPRLKSGTNTAALRAEHNATGEYYEVGSLGVGDRAFADLDASHDPACSLSLHGSTLAGLPVCWDIQPSPGDANTTMTAVERPQADGGLPRDDNRGDGNGRVSAAVRSSRESDNAD